MSKLSHMFGVLFPGQGAQYVGMGKTVYEHEPAARALFDSADRILGGNFLQLLFEGPQESLTATDVSQPAIYTVSCAVWAVIRAKAPHARPAATAGLSLGEYSALTAAGCLPFEEGLHLVRQRGLFMQEAAKASPGTMASVLGLEDDKVAAICSTIDGAFVANYNCPGQIVISGECDAIRQASAACSEAGARRVIPLTVSGAFHSPLMSKAQSRLLPLLNQTAWKPPAFPVLSNVTGLPYNNASEIPELLGRQIVESVRWEDDCRWLLLHGITTCIEAGPGTVLQGLMKKIERALDMTSVERSVDIDALVCA